MSATDAAVQEPTTQTGARVITADPPWKLGDSLPGKNRGAEKNYPCLDVWEIQRFPLPEIAPDAILFLWRLSSMVEEAYAVCRAWGFVPKTEIVWSKTLGEDTDEEESKDAFGMGRYTRGAHETCIVATRGKMIPHIKDKGIRSLFRAPVGKHSEKPEAFFQLVEKLVDGPYVEIFSRKPRPGWLVIGNEIPGGSLYTPLPSAPPAPPILEVSEAGVASGTIVNGVGKKEDKPLCPTCGLRQFILPNGWNCGNSHFIPLPPNAPKPSAEERTVDMPFVHAADVAPAELTKAMGTGPGSQELGGKPMNFDLATPPTVTTTPTPPAAGEMPFDNFSKLVEGLHENSVLVTLIDVSGMTPLQRGTAQAWMEQGGKENDRPEFLDRFMDVDAPSKPVPPFAENKSFMSFPANGTLCSECRLPQRVTPGGLSCPNGHGGAEPLIEHKDAVVLRAEPFTPNVELMKASLAANADSWAKAEAIMLAAESAPVVAPAPQVVAAPAAVVAVPAAENGGTTTEPPKKRGRPSKADIAAREAATANAPATTAAPTEPPKKRGRPSKADIAAREATAAPTTVVTAPVTATTAPATDVAPAPAKSKWDVALDLVQNGVDPIDENGFFTEGP